MNKKVPSIIYILLPVLILGFIFWYGWGPDSFRIRTLVLKTGYNGDLGQIGGLDSLVEHNFVLLNKRDSEEKISKIYTDCNCLSVLVPFKDEFLGPYSLPTDENERPIDLTLLPSGEMKLKVVFYPGKTDKINFYGKVFIESGQPRQILEIPIR